MEWIEDIVLQCGEHGIPVSVKQAHDENGRVIKMPKIFGRVRDQYPEGLMI